MEKQKITVSVAGKSYTLVSSDPPEYVKRIAALVDRKLRETETATNLPSAQAAVLTCFNLADQMLRAKDENTELQRRMRRMEAQMAEGDSLRRRRSGGGEKESEAEK